MRFQKYFVICVVVICTLISITCPVSCEEKQTACEAVAAPVEEAKVSVQSEKMKITEILGSFASQSKQKILVESSVKGTLILSLNDISLESALEAVCKSAKLQWRKIYINPKSELLEQPDKLAATVRLLAGISFPDIVLAGSSVNKVGAYFEDKQAVKSSEAVATGKLDMKPIYLITDDSAMAKKAKKDAEKTAVDEYADLARKQIEKFMDMTAEEREQAMMESINMMDQIDPSYMAMATQAMMNAAPETWQRIQRRSGEMLFNMSTEDRRRFLKMSMKMQKGMFTPEQMQILKEDSEAVMEELKESGEIQPSSN